MQQFQDDIMKNKELTLEINRKLSQRIDELDKRMAQLEKMINKSLKDNGVDK